MNLLLPMAGAGQRFIDEGYKVPKPIIPILGKPMVRQAIESFPSGCREIFIIRTFHKEEFQLDEELYRLYPESEIVYVDELTEGQACTCLLAKEQINNSSPLYIGACDNGMIYDVDKLRKLQDSADVILFTFRNNSTVIHNPKAYGWVKVKGGDHVSQVSVKVPISEDPVNDHAIVGAFWFREGSSFVEAAESMISQDRRVNGEFYVDECINNCVSKGLDVRVFEIDSYICWGTPNDLKTFNYWESYFSKVDFHPYKK